MELTFIDNIRHQLRSDRTFNIAVDQPPPPQPPPPPGPTIITGSGIGVETAQLGSATELSGDTIQRLIVEADHVAVPSFTT